MTANRRTRSLRLGLALLALVSLLVAFVPSASATAPYTCVSPNPASESHAQAPVRQAGPNTIVRDHAVTVVSDQCGVGTFTGDHTIIQFPNGDFQGHGSGVFSGAMVDSTGKPRAGSIEFRASVHGSPVTEGRITVRLTFLSGTGTGGLANLHGGGVEVVDTTTSPPSMPMVWQLHWDP